MKEIISVRLENEMDLILAHKRTMKLAELTGLSLIVQTSIATAVSEIARCAIEHGQGAELKLFIEVNPQNRFLEAAISDPIDFTGYCKEAIQYAERLVSGLSISRTKNEMVIKLTKKIATATPLTESSLKYFIDYFKLEPPLSPYDEIRRKNVLLQELAEKVQERENNFRRLTDSLPLMMFSATRNGVINYSNKWVSDFLGTPPKELGAAAWKNIIHSDEYVSFSRSLTDGIAKQIPVNGQYRLKSHSTGEFIWHLLSIIPLKNEKSEVTLWIGFLVDIQAEIVVGKTSKENSILKATQEKLFENQNELKQKIVELNRSNYELEQFAHLASHDLQEPLRKIFFFSDTLSLKYADQIDEGGVALLNKMRKSAARMKELINDLLTYSQLQKQNLSFEQVDLNAVIVDVINEVDLVIREKSAIVEKDTLPVVTGNMLRLRQLLINLISNALKYSKKEVPPHITVRSLVNKDTVTLTVRDNGIGFDQAHSERIFGLFERLHTRDQFPGTGIGLSICRKITDLHGGTIKATSAPGEFSEFEVTLPIFQP